MRHEEEEVRFSGRRQGRGGQWRGLGCGAVVGGRGCGAVAGRVFKWRQRSLISLGELVSRSGHAGMESAMQGGFNSMLESYRLLVQQAGMPCMVPALYFKMRMDSPDQEAPVDEQGATREKMK